jgi:hypothetical protein
MAGFWQHYAQANDDIRTELIDRAWFDRRVGNNAMEKDVQTMQQSGDIHGQGPEAQGQTVQGFYGEPAASQEDALEPEQSQDDPAAALYGEPDTQTESAQLYGYDALDDEDQDEELSQRM